VRRRHCSPPPTASSHQGTGQRRPSLGRAAQQLHSYAHMRHAARPQRPSQPPTFGAGDVTSAAICAHLFRLTPHSRTVKSLSVQDTKELAPKQRLRPSSTAPYLPSIPHPSPMSPPPLIYHRIPGPPCTQACAGFLAASQPLYSGFWSALKMLTVGEGVGGLGVTQPSLL